MAWIELGSRLKYSEDLTLTVYRRSKNGIQTNEVAADIYINRNYLINNIHNATKYSAFLGTFNDWGLLLIDFTKDRRTICKCSKGQLMRLSIALTGLIQCTKTRTFKKVKHDFFDNKLIVVLPTDMMQMATAAYRRYRNNDGGDHGENNSK